MSRLDDAIGWVEQQLPALLEEYDVPAAAVAILAEGEVADFAAGVLSRSTGVEATADSVFQIGSITKLWTSTLVMQLVDEGLVDLDAPVRDYLPDFRIADESAAATITVRQLLTHTSGFEGDIFTDTGRGDDAVEKYLATLHDVPQLFPPGDLWSYNNAGFVVLGRLVEVLRGTTYDACLRERIVAPLGLTQVAPSPYEAILHRAAVGHLEAEPGTGYVAAPVWALVRSNAPAGSMLAMTARDLVGFARMHLADGQSPDGARVLAAGTAARMREQQVELPDLGNLAASWGLGFERWETSDGLVVGHDGGTIGQVAFLRIVPEADVAVALLTNGGNSVSLYRDVMGHLLAELAGVRLPALPAPPAEPEPVDAGRWLGTYSCDVGDIVVTQDDDGRVWATETPKGVALEMGDVERRYELVLLRDDTLIRREPELGMYRVYAFLGDDGSDHALYAHVGRAIRRATD
ncbi:serine hydrolase domain-containing protein [Nocardioides cynanchi]|uniref:serine hydrolase domain-containing protein n=1 Tax=Nocardioides cynanchi TaxID=2558918 RepID=UPI0012494941|nr:serine hydrolase domain-containing protein [Nocardioides cynanchi]